MKTRSSLAALAAAALLAACGGGGDFDNTPPPPVIPPTSAVPPSASLSANGFIAYLVALVASPADTLEPVDTSAVTGPTIDTSEPTPVD
jgi:hypothetical protein